MRPVAPPAGAWIETTCCAEWVRLLFVAPPAGAWIETAIRLMASFLEKSRPLRARGLKQ